MSAPFLYKAYVALTAALVPLAAWHTTSKLRRAGVSVTRAHEKLGHATEERRGSGPLVWFHAASVGESLSVLALITRMGLALPQAQFLITSGTATSADLVARRLPARTVHQFAPLDAPGPLKRFLTHWRPDAAIFVESELWPQMLRRTHASGARMALVNARLSAGSIQRWQKRPRLARYIFEVFTLILTQNDAMAEALVAMNAPPERVARGSNLKSLSDPLPVDHDTLYEARAALGHRPVWIASSTHAGEEETVLAAHAALLKRHPDLHLILAPRHPDRSAEVAGLIEAAGLRFTTRSKGEAPGAQVYLADTMGELGSWYALGRIVFLGGSLRPIGGHNAYEVAQAGAAILSGRHVSNFSETYAALEDAGAVTFVDDATSLAENIARLLEDPAALDAAAGAAEGFAARQTDKLDSIAARLIAALELAP